MHLAISDLEQSRQLLARRLLLIWRNPETRKYSRVAVLDRSADGLFSFSYVEGVANLPGFYPLDEYPDVNNVYRSETLPAFFVNRIMSTSRPNYQRYLAWLGVSDQSPQELSIDLLARTGGGRATDTFHIVEMPVLDGEIFEARFFVSGIRHLKHAASVFTDMHVGELLILTPEPENPVNPLAQIISVKSGAQVGWLPDWLSGEIAILQQENWSLEIKIDQINMDAPPHSRLLCRLTGKSVAV